MSAVSSVTNEELIKQISRLELYEEKGEEKENTAEDGEKEHDYDEEYCVSLDDVYPAEDDFLQVNTMNKDPREKNKMLNLNSSGGKKEPSDTPDNMDDFQFYLSSIDPSSITLTEERTGVKDTIIPETLNPLKTSPHAKKEKESATDLGNVSTIVAAKKDVDDHDELDELERYLLKLSAT